MGERKTSIKLESTAANQWHAKCTEKFSTYFTHEEALSLH